MKYSKTKLNFSLLTICLITLFYSCISVNRIDDGENYLNLSEGKIWYEVVGESDNTPIVLLHGGPGYPSYYLNPLKQLKTDRQVILFDQLGCGRSDRMTDTSLMTIDSYVEQTRKLIASLGIKEFILYGHSWGTILGIEYYSKYPEGIKALILGSPCINVEQWQSDADTLISYLPDSIQTILNQSRLATIADSIKFNEALNYYYDKYYTRKLPFSDDVTKSDEGWSMEVYEYMWGKSEFSADGKLKNYDGTELLKNLKIPVLFITGEYDPARPETVEKYHELTPNSVFKIISGVGHFTMHDKPKEEIKVINEFITGL